MVVRLRNVVQAEVSMCFVCVDKPVAVRIDAIEGVQRTRVTCGASTTAFTLMGAPFDHVASRALLAREAAAVAVATEHVASPHATTVEGVAPRAAAFGRHLAEHEQKAECNEQPRRHQSACSCDQVLLVAGERYISICYMGF